MSDVTYTSEELLGLANYFETLGNDQLACVRFQTLKREKDECKTKAEVWQDAASYIREQVEAHRNG